MSNVTLFGFPRSTFVKVVGLILTAKGVTYSFHDTEEEMYLPIHLQRHPFGRVPALQHDDFMLYETSASAMPKVIRALEVMEKELSDGRPFIVGDAVTMADFFLLPTLFGFALTPEGKQLLPKFRAIQAWDNRMDTLPSVIRFNASLPPRAPIPHAREWVHHHRPAA